MVLEGGEVGDSVGGVRSCYGRGGVVTWVGGGDTMGQSGIVVGRSEWEGWC